MTSTGNAASAVVMSTMAANTVATSEEFAVRTDPLRGELLAHCYRMLGSVHDAEDQLQETLLRAWRAYDQYDPRRAALRTWLYRIATNTCLTALEQRSRRPLPSGLGAPGDDPDAPMVRGEEVPWLQPIPDALLGDPAGVASSRHTLRLAFLAALQLLPARQRAVLILRDVLDWPAAEVGKALEMTTTAVHSALRRARARLATAGLGEDQVGEPHSPDERALVERYVAAFESADLVALEKLLTDDVLLEMPPMLGWYVGREHYVRFIARLFTLRGAVWRMVPVAANGHPAVAAYVRAPDGDGFVLNTVQVFEISDGRISRNTAFRDAEVFAVFRLPERI
ncbi:sigma-70 family RNA polymerase sigma factor [Catenulispora yoronensis]|uniref:Sigma-70 family RNA polymerase sigma factor n=1 Tax=Catenulispora yoronensis TaxID=450799 RepID=A0ABP5GUG7_9ACTN